MINESYTIVHNLETPVYIYFIQGCKYCHDKFKRDYGPWTAFRTLDYGYTRVQVFNSSHLSLEQVSIDKVSGSCCISLWTSLCEVCVLDYFN